MKSCILILLAFALIFTSCSVQNENPVTGSGEGKVFFKVSKENAPVSVTMVKLTLTRTGFTTINGQLDLLTDTTAELTLEGIPEGSWHLKVDAVNSNNILLYTGEANIAIIADQLTQINLTLNPVSSGLGSIKINVNWGTVPVSNFFFKDYASNPVLTPLDTGWDVNISHPVVIHDGSKYRMYYSSLTYGARGAVGYAESQDGFNWSRPFDHPLVYPGPDPNSWDGQCITPGAIIKDNNIYYLFYTGFRTQNATWSIGLATSVDGISWNKHPQPVLQGGSGYEYQVIPTSVIKKNGQFLLYYTGRNYPQYKTAVATSSDCINWTKSNLNPIVTASLPWEGTKVTCASVVADGDSLIMVYSTTQGDKHYFGMASSVDGFSWNKRQTPVFNNLSTTDNWARSSIDYTTLIKSGNQLRIYYAGYNGDQWARIGVTIWNRD